MVYHCQSVSDFLLESSTLIMYTASRYFFSCERTISNFTKYSTCDSVLIAAGGANFRAGFHHPSSISDDLLKLYDALSAAQDQLTESA
jgi:hypothetical protein